MKLLHILTIGVFISWLALFAVLYCQGIVTSKVYTSRKTISLDLKDLSRNSKENQLISEIFPGDSLETIKPKRKVILLYIDGFRESFIDGDFINYVGEYHSYRMRIFKDLLQTNPKNLQLSTCLTVAPTMTMQGVLRLLTGNYPSYLEIVNQLKHEDELAEDSFIFQAKQNGLRIKSYGRDSISAFYKNSIDQTFITSTRNMKEHQLEKKYINEGIQYIFNNPDEWDLATFDSTTLDNTAHTVCSNCKQNDDAMKRTEEIIDNIIKNMTNDTTLVIVSDHGRDDIRDHGGNSLGELFTVFSMYQKGLKFKIDPIKENNVTDEKLRIVPFISITSTISNLLQTYIPFSNVGVLLPEYLIYNESNSQYEIYSDLFKSLLLNELQLIIYVKEYISLATDHIYQASVVKLNNFLKDLDKNRDKTFEILQKMRINNSKINNETSSSIVEMIKSYHFSLKTKADSIASSLDPLLISPSPSYSWFLVAISLLFLIVLPFFIVSLSLLSKPKLDEISKSNLKLRFIVLCIQFILIFFVNKHNELIYLICVVNLWILYPIANGVIHRIILRELKWKHILCIISIIIALLISSWTTLISDHLETIAFYICRILLMIFIVYHFWHKEYHQSIKLGVYLVLFASSFNNYTFKYEKVDLFETEGNEYYIFAFLTILSGFVNCTIECIIFNSILPKSYRRSKIILLIQSIAFHSLMSISWIAKESLNEIFEGIIIRNLLILHFGIFIFFLILMVLSKIVEIKSSYQICTEINGIFSSSIRSNFWSFCKIFMMIIFMRLLFIVYGAINQWWLCMILLLRIEIGLFLILQF